MCVLSFQPLFLDDPLFLGIFKARLAFAGVNTVTKDTIMSIRWEANVHSSADLQLNEGVLVCGGERYCM